MYMNESVNRLIGILKRQADGDYELAKELSLKGSPNWVGAQAYFYASQKALETAQNWAEREKRDDPTPAKNDPNKATADTISPCREGEQVLSRSEVEELRAENARLRALLGIVDGHAGEIVRALSTAEATR